MALPRPLITVYDVTDKTAKPVSNVLMPTVMQTPIRPDLISFVHSNMMKNSRQAYAVKDGAGYGTSAESWGTGRAVSRIPRVPGGGTHRAGQGAFGNMCRRGGMFAPTKIWRRWHRHINTTQKRHALSSAIAGSAITSLVIGHGHCLEQVSEIPLVVTDDIQQVKKTKSAIQLLYALGCGPDVEKSKNTRQIRTGSGKSRNRRYTMRKGPLIVYCQDKGLVKAFENIPGVTTTHVDRLNLLDIAPGGVVGRLVIWTESAISRLQDLYGDYDSGSMLKSGYTLPRPVMNNADLNRIINSNEVQSKVNAAKENRLKARPNRNPLKNRSVRCRLDPAFKSRTGFKRRLLSNHLKQKKLDEKPIETNTA